MGDVRLTIAGRPYDVHCADGQEPQLIHLASLVDEKARSITGGTEVRQLLFAALMLADETQETRVKMEKAAPQSDSLRAAVALAKSREAQARDELQSALAELQAMKDMAKDAAAAPAQLRTAHDRALIQIADRIEALATKVEQIP